jgi:hypothetical protein
MGHAFIVGRVFGISITAEFKIAVSKSLLSRRTFSPSFQIMIYNYTIMTIADWLGIVLTSLSILTIVSIGIRWVIRHYLKDVIHELKPNGGSSLKDQVNRLEKDVVSLKDQNVKGEIYHEKLDSKLDRLTEMFVNYVSSQNKK